MNETISATQGPLPQFVNRLSMLTDRVGGLVERMNDHADKLRGTIPAVTGADTKTPAEYSGALGDMEAVLNRLELFISEAYSAHYRNEVM